MGFSGEGDEYDFGSPPAHGNSGSFGEGIAATVPTTELGTGDEGEPLLGYQFELDKLPCGNS